MRLSRDTGGSKDKSVKRCTGEGNKTTRVPGPDPGSGCLFCPGPLGARLGWWRPVGSHCVVGTGKFMLRQFCLKPILNRRQGYHYWQIRSSEARTASVTSTDPSLGPRMN
jgi:hypothetical protein